MPRRPDWQSAFDEFLVANRATPFVWGQWDCCLFVCDAICTMTGVDPAARFRGAYASAREARRMMRAAGAGSLAAMVEAITSEHSMPEVPVRYAQRGDVALIGCTLGLVALNGRDVVVPSSRGLWRVPMARAVRAWRV